MSQSDSLLIVFVKNPVEGRVKTRLAESVGPERALTIYEQLLDHTLHTVRPLEVDIQVWYSDEVSETSRWDSVADEMLEQRGKDLGIRMEQAFRQAFDRDYQKVVIIGSDCAELKTDHIKNAFHELDQNHVVIGPAEDGGYYLLGMDKLYESFFHEKAWSTDTVYEDTLEDIRELGLNCHRLPVLNDVDRLEDWEKIKNRLQSE